MAGRIRDEDVKAVRDATSQYMIDNSSNCPRGVDDLVTQKYLDRTQHAEGAAAGALPSGSAPALLLPGKS